MINGQISGTGNECNDSQLTTVGKESYIHQVTLHGYELKMKIWDTAGQERFKSMSVQVIKNSDAVIIGPSNPVTSILPILSLEGVRDALKDTYVVAVSPIIGSGAVSGPANKFMKALDIDVSAVGVASLYRDFLDNIVIDDKDSNMKSQIKQIVNKVTVTNTIMNNLGVKKNLAQIIIDSIP